MNDYAIIIPAYNEEAFLPQSLASVATAVRDVSGKAGVVVVDNNSSDRTAQIARDMGAAVVYEPINQIARARNAGARAAESRHLIFLDADTTLTPALLEAALRNLHSGRVAGGGTLVAFDRPLEPSAQRALDAWNRLSGLCRIAAGCFIYCEKTAFEAIGGFSQRIYASEEIWFSLRMQLWARRRGKRFQIIRQHPATTSVRKIEWFSPARLLASSLLLTCFPPALFSRRLCHIWYDRPASRTAPD